LFDTETIDGLTIEQYNVLIELYNKKVNMEETGRGKPRRYTTNIVSVEGDPGVNYGDN
jgi:hypothetical protein